jgi:superoxide dismutase, Cu-Zn family
VPGTHNIPKNITIWFSEVSNKKFFMMTYNRPKPHFVIDVIHSKIKKVICMACTLFLLLIVAIVLILGEFVMTGRSMSAQAVLMNEGGGTGVAGTILITQLGRMEGSEITGTVTGLTPGKHGFHIHANASAPGQCASAGGHYNPKSVSHAALTEEKRHVGDLGNIVANAEGVAEIDIFSKIVFVDDKPTSVVGRSFVIHQKADDLGLGGNAGSLASGNAGARVACGTIVKVG